MAIDIRQFASDPAAFQNAIVIPSVYGPQRFGDCMAEFQRERFAGINPSLLAIANGTKPDINRHWWEATKGASKDSDLAVCLLWLLAFTRRPLACQVGAADKDQADEMRKCATDILRLNPWLDARVKILSWKIVCKATNSECEILSADTAGSHGARPDVLILNELSHITKQEFAENLMDNATKVPHGIAVIATNAGFQTTWQEKWRELALMSDRWLMHIYDQPSPWLADAEIDEAKKRNSKSRYLRLFWGIWASGLGDAIDVELIDAAFKPDLQQMVGTEPGYSFVGGIDLGVKRDASAVVVLAVGKSGTPYYQKIRLAAHKRWLPTDNRKVDLREVQRYVHQLDQRFSITQIGFDSWNAELLAAQLEAEKKARSDRKFGFYDEQPFMREIPPTASNLREICTLMIESFHDGRFALYDCPALLSDLLKLKVVERAYGSRLESPRDSESGHGDLASAFGLALLTAHQVALKPDPLVGALNLDEGTPFGYEASLHEHEQELFNQPEDWQEPFRDLMKRNFPKRQEIKNARLP